MFLLNLISSYFLPFRFRQKNTLRNQKSKTKRTSTCELSENDVMVEATNTSVRVKPVDVSKKRKASHKMHKSSQLRKMFPFFVFCSLEDFSHKNFKEDNQ